MDNDREQILAQLYGIRAGMSVISQEADKIKNLQARQKNAERELQLFPQTNLDRQKSYIAEIKTLEKDIEAKQKEVDKQGLVFRNFVLPIIFGFLKIFAIFLCLAIGICLGYWGVRIGFLDDALYKEIETAIGGWVNLLIIVALLWSPGIGIGSNIAIISSIVNDGLFVNLITPKKIRAQKEKAKQDLADLRKNLAYYKGLLAQTKTNYPLQYQECKNTTKQLNTSFIETLNNATVLIAALHERYDDFLDPRDWQHVDLLIFYFETRRVDTVKEALQHVDGQIRTNEISQAIQRASAEIKQTIKDSTYRLAKFIDSGIALLSHQLGNILQAQNIHAAQLAKLSAQTSKLITSQNMMQALQEKSNTTSAQMAEYMHYVQTLAENGEIRRRNNP